MVAAGHRDFAEVSRFRAVQMHMPARRERHHLRRAEEAVGCLIAVQARRALGAGGLTEARRAPTRTFVHGAESHHRLGLTGGHRHRGLQDGADRAATAAVIHFARIAQFGNAQIARDIDGVVVVHRVFGDAVDVGRGEAGVGDRGADGLAGQR